MIAFLNQYLFGAAVPILLVASGIFYSFRLGFFHLRYPILVLRTLTERQTSDGVSPLRALSLALAGTLGVGNIVGVSAAIALGGFGAIFWMWVSALCAMLLKYAEIVLAVRHRRYDKDGTPHGSAMHYIRDGLSDRRLPRLGALLASLFAILCLVNSVTMGSIIQVNAVSGALSGVFSISPWITGSVLAIATLLTVRRGSRGVLSLTDKLVPIMTLGYLALSIAVLVLRAEQIPHAFAEIFSAAFTPEAGFGGIGGFALSRGVRYGTMRGLISNEAGCGTAPIAHAASNCRTPAKQGVFGIVEVFTDTILLCTVTALVVIVSWGEVSHLEGDFMMMTIRAYSAVLGDFAAGFMSIAVLFFGFATVLCWAHYGVECVGYLSRKKLANRCFILLYSASVLIGAFADSAAVWSLADFAIGAMTLINVSVLCLMSREVKSETDTMLSRRSRIENGKSMRSAK